MIPSRHGFARAALVLLALFAIGSAARASLGSAPRRPARPPVPVTGEGGLVFRLSDAGEETARAVRPEAAASAQPLDETRVRAILDRLPALPPDERRDVALRPGSLPAPRTGVTVVGPFPAPSAAPPPEAGTAEPLAVVRRSPEGDVPLASHLSVTFSQPMVAVTSHDALGEARPVRITPEPPGAWRWVGTRTLLFEPEGRFPMATTYEVEVAAGARSAAGGLLAGAERWRFNTPPPKVVSRHPENESARRDALMFAAFDQRIDPRAVLAALSISTGAGAAAVRLADPAEVRDDQTVAALAQAAGEGRWLAFRATEELPADTTVTVTVGTGTPSAEGPLTTREAQSWSFRTYGPLRVSSYRCGWNGQCPPLTPWQIEMTNPLDAERVTADLVRVEPELPGQRVDVNGPWIVVHGRSKGRTRYAVTLDAAVADVFGQTLGQPARVSFDVGPAPARVWAGGGDLVVLDPAARQRFSVLSVNQPALVVRAFRVTPADWPAYRAFFRTAQRDRARPTPPGTLVFDRKVPTRGAADDVVETALDLSEVFAGGTGHAIVIVEPTEKGDTRSFPGRVVTWVQSTALGLDAAADSVRLLVRATDLATGRPLADVEVRLGSARVATDAGGVAPLPWPAEAAELLVASRGADTAFLPASRWTWDEARWTRPGAAADTRFYVFDDRGLYRPGETARVKGVVRRLGEGPRGDVEAADVPALTWVLRDSRGNEVLKGSADVSELGSFDLSLALPDTMNLGAALLELSARARSVSHQHAIQVQEFRRPEFEVTAAASEGPHFVGGSATADVTAAYFAGGPLPDAEVRWTVSARPGTFRPPNRDDFTFGGWNPWWMPWREPAAQRVETHQARTDAAGRHRLRIDFVSADPPRVSDLTAEATVTDVNRQQWTATVNTLVHPAALYVGLRAVRPFVQAGQTLEVDLIAVDLEGGAVGGREMAVRAERLEWRRKGNDWREEPAEGEDCTVASASDPVRCTFRPRGGGAYRVRATVRDDEDRPNESEIRLWVAGGEAPPTRELGEEKVTLVPDQREYAAGGVARVLVMAPFADAEGLLTLRRSGIVRHQAFRIQGASHTLEIPIEEAFTPNIHAHVSLVGRAPRTDDDGKPRAGLAPRPAFAAGSVNLPVPPRQRTLGVAVAAEPKAVEPGGTAAVDLRVTDADGRPVPGAEVAIVVVDEAVLSLTGYRIPDPLGVFYAERAEGVTDYRLRSRVVLARPEDAETIEVTADSPELDGNLMAERLSATGYAGGSPQAPPAQAPMARMAKRADAAPPPPPPPPPGPAIAMRTDFAALALFAPRERTGPDGRLRVEVKVPDNLTRYRITAVAVGDVRRFGKGEATLTARLPLMVRPSPPRFLNFGDRFELPVVVQNQTDEAMTVDLAVRASNATLTAGAGRRVTVPANNRVEVRFPAAAEQAGRARFQIGGAAGRWADAAQVELPVWTPATTEAFATYGQIDQGAIRQPVERPNDALTQVGGLEVTTTSTALHALTDAVLYLQSYPYECAEQIASRVLSTAALRDVLTAFAAEGLPSPEEQVAAMERDLEFLARLQNDDGGWPFWRRGDRSWPWVSIHVAHALQRAKAKGFAVPEPALLRAREHLRRIEQHIPSEYGPFTRRTVIAYALSVRQLMGDHDPARARAVFKEGGTDGVSFEALGWLLAVMSPDAGSRAEVALIRRHLDNRVAETAAAAHFAVSYGEQEHLVLHSSRRADAVILDALIADQPQAGLIPKLVTGLLAHRKAGRWENTQENVFVLLALDRYFHRYEGVTPDFAARLWLGDRGAGEHRFRGRTTERHHVDVPMSALGAREDLVIAKDGPGRLYYRIGLRYAPKSLDLAPAEHGFAVERVYEAVDAPEDVRRDADGTWRMRAGARVRVRLTLAAPGRRAHVALVDPLPAGLEPLNPELATTGSLPKDRQEDDGGPWWRRFAWWWRWYEHQNLRDERVEAFASLLPGGVYRYDYIARATTPGQFVVPPAKAEEMYHPETFGRTGTDRVVVESPGGQVSH